MNKVVNVSTKIIFAIMMLYAVPSNAQIVAGMKAGLNMSNFYSNEINDKNVKTGFTAGIFVKAQLADFLAIQPEVLYSLKGSQVYYDGFLGSGKVKYNLHYLEIPILAVINITENFNIHVGPYAGVLLAVSEKTVSSDGSWTYEELDRDDFNTLDYGLAGGIGLDFQGGSLSFRYNYGLNPLGQEGTFADEALPNARNSVLQIGLAFNF